eukprot:PITA_09313
MGINQMQLNSLAVASDLGKIMGWVAGRACLFLPTWAVLAIGMSLGMVGYGVQWLVLSQIIPPLAYWQVYALCFIAGNSICWFNTVSYKAAIENFPSDRGMASGLSTSYVGLSPAIFSCLSSILDPGNPSLYLLLNSIVPVVVGVILAVILHLSELQMTAIEDDADRKFMILCTLISLATAIYSIVFEFLPHGKRQLEGVYFAVLILLLMAPIYIPVKVFLRSEVNVNLYISSPEQHNATFNERCEVGFIETEDNKINIQSLDIENSLHPEQHNPTFNEICEVGFIETEDNKINIQSLDIENSLHPEQHNPTFNERCEVGFIETEDNKINIQSLDIEISLQTVHNFYSTKSRRFELISVPPLGEEHGIMQLLRSFDFWLYYLVYFCGGTVGIVYMNNLGQIVQSLGYSNTPILVSLVSSFGFFGRIASGLPDYIQKCGKLRKYRPLPRPGWIGIWMVPMFAAFFMLRFMNPTSSVVLYTSTAIVGTSTGAISAIAIPISSEMFGMKSFGVNHNIIVTNIAFGSLLFGEVAGIIYDDSPSSSSGMPKHPKDSADWHLCMGTQCYEKSFLMWGCVCLFGILLCVVLCMRTRELYESIDKKQSQEIDQN